MLATITPMPHSDMVPMLDKNNIINVRDGESLYQICLKLRRRLSEVPGFRPYLDEMEEQESDAGTDPVSSLWRCFRSGIPLLAIYNASQPEEGNLEVDMSKREDKIGKEAAFLFIKACMQQMDISPQDTFTLTDLYSDNTTGFVKVTKLVNRVLDILSLSGKLYPSTDSDDSKESLNGTNSTNGSSPKQLTRRQHILKELVETERQYVHHLLNLQALKKELEESGALTGDSIHQIFLNLNNLLDFAQRFLIRVEQHNELPEEFQNWGELFIHYKDPFRQYEPFIANQLRCEATCQKEWEKMRASSRSPLMEQMLANSTILNGFLLKPFQRLTKYPLLLKDLQSQTKKAELQANLAGAIEIIHNVLQQADASIDKEKRLEAWQDLSDRVEDWKSLTLRSFGDLILFGTFTVLKGDGTSKDQEKEYHIYLFERILLCCKDVNMNKQKSKIMGGTNKPPMNLRGKPRLQLKGRIFLANVTHILTSTGSGNYTIQIFWRGDPGVENFVIKFKNDETMRRWNREIESQRASEVARTQRPNGTSETQFISLRGVHMENPHQEYDGEEEENRILHPPYPGAGFSEFSMSRNASSTSLRSRSTTGGSGGSANTHGSMARAPARFPMPEPSSLPPLNTQFLQHVTQSPGDRSGNSYFSPIDKETSTPLSVSARSSGQSSFTSYNRYGTPVNGWSHGEESITTRNTAPAMSRNMVANGGGNPYLVNTRVTGVRPTLPASGTIQSAQQIGMSINRTRSASSPDVHHNLPPNRRYANGSNPEHVPTVPPIPAHVAGRVAPVNRSNSNSPISGSNGLPIRNGVPSSAVHHTYGLPSGPRPPMASNYTYDSSYTKVMDPRQIILNSAPFTLSAAERALSPPLSTLSSDGEPFMPSQLKAKVCFDSNYITLVIASNIQFRSLTDRIDAKLARFTGHSIGSGSVRLRYRDEDGDFIWINSDEAVHDAFLDWRETHADKLATGQTGEILLYCHSVNGEPIAGT